MSAPAREPILPVCGGFGRLQRVGTVRLRLWVRGAASSPSLKLGAQGGGVQRQAGKDGPGVDALAKEQLVAGNDVQSGRLRILQERRPDRGIDRVKGPRSADHRSGGQGRSTITNHAGGTHGGISNGNEVLFRVGFKPVAIIAVEQTTINRAGEEISFSATGRHDPCVVPRAVPIVEAMSALVIADFYLISRTNKLNH